MSLIVFEQHPRITFCWNVRFFITRINKLKIKKQIYDSRLRIMLIVQQQISFFPFMNINHGVMYDCRRNRIMFHLQRLLWRKREKKKLTIEHLSGPIKVKREKNE